MNQPKTVAEDLTYWDFTAMRFEWNRRHKTDKDMPAAPSADRVRAAFAKIPAAAFGGPH